MHLYYTYILYICTYTTHRSVHTKFLFPLESVRLGQFSMDTEVFNTSVDISIINTHKALQDNRWPFPILKYLK